VTYLPYPYSPDLLVRPKMRDNIDVEVMFRIGQRGGDRRADEAEEQRLGHWRVCEAGREHVARM
jgi:hypothetical protein